jgi:hypothetical protein
MNFTQIVAKFLKDMPALTTEFSEYLTPAITNIQIVARTVRVTTATAHGLISGRSVIAICGEVKNTIKEIEIDGNNAIIELNDNHDYILEDDENNATQVEIAGNSSGAWNGTFTIIDIPDRSKITIEKPDSVLPATTGYIWEDRSKNGSGVVEVTKISDTVFSFPLDSETPNLPLTTLKSLKIVTGSRIAGVADPERAIDLYSETTNFGEKPWLFIMIGDESVSKDLNAQSDAQATNSGGDDSRARLMNDIDILAIIPCVGDDAKTGGFQAVEKATGEIKQAILDCFQGYVLDIESSDRVWKAVYTGSQPYVYNKATYIRNYSFQISYDITSRQEVASVSESVALRKTIIDLSIGNGNMTASVEHEEV